MINSDQETVGGNSGVRELVIVGAGPAGIAAAIEALEDGLHTLCIDAAAEVGGQLLLASWIDDVHLGFTDGVKGGSGEDVAYQYRRITQRLGLNLRLNTRVTEMAFDTKDEMKILHLSDGDMVQARSVILALGLELKTLQFPGSEANNVIHGGAARLVDEAANKTVVIVAERGYEWGAEAALEAAHSAKHVHLVYQPRNAARHPDVMAWHHNDITVHGPDEIERAQTDHQDNPTSVVMKSGKTLPCDVLGLFAKGQPNTDWLPPRIKRIGGKIVTRLPSDIPGVFAAGDITHETSMEALSQAKVQGMSAAMDAYEYLKGARPKRYWEG